MYILKWLPFCLESKTYSGLVILYIIRFYIFYIFITKREWGYSDGVERGRMEQNKAKYVLDCQASVISRGV